MGKKIQKNRLKEKFTKITTNEGGGTMKIFGDDLNPSIPYKTLLLSVNDTAEWIVKEMLEKYGLKHENPQNYCLLQIVIPIHDEIIQELILHDKECPLNIYLNHIQKPQGSVIFKVIPCPLEYIEIRKRFRTQESPVDLIQMPGIQDRTIPNKLPMFIEVMKDGSHLPAPRVFKLHPNITYVGRDTKAGNGKRYFYIDCIDIDPDHCIIQNQNDSLTLIPHGEIWLNGEIISRPFILQHGALICFGRNSTFRYYDPQSIHKMHSISAQTNQQNGNNQLNMKNVLPGLLDVPIDAENQFLHAVFNNYPLKNMYFRLSPVYTLYMTLRHRLSPIGTVNLPSIQKQKHVTSLLYRIEDIISKKIEECQKHAGYLAYWLANTSELIFFLKHDRDLFKISSDIQIHLIKSIQKSYYYLINLFENELDKYLEAFTNSQEDIDLTIHTDLSLSLSDTRWITSEKNPNNYYQLKFDDILTTLSSIIDLLRKCRVNVTLTIEIFSQIFHYINAWLFNRIVCCPELKLCSYLWGEKFLIRLKSLKTWAHKQGLESSSECYLMKIDQLCLLLKSPKRDLYDVQKLISNNPWQINSLQIKQILTNYIPSRNELPISNNFSQALISIAYEHVDKKLHRDGLALQLAEGGDLNLSFLLPEDGYTCETLRHIPQELFEFIEPISQLGLCCLFTNTYSVGMWTEFMETSNKTKKNVNERIETIVLNKKGNSLGLNIVSAKSEFQQYYGIYIKRIIPNSAADDDGRLQPGDQILCVDKISLIDITREQAVQVLKQCGPLVTLLILKDAAKLHGLSTLLSIPSKNHHEFVLQPNHYSSQEQVDNHKKTNFTRSKSCMSQKKSPTKTVAFREDIPPDKKHYTKPMMNSVSFSNGDEYDEKLKRRLEQFDQEREVERIYINEMFAKREADIKAHLHKNREREIRADLDMEEFKTRRMSREDRFLQARKEEARLLKQINKIYL